MSRMIRSPLFLMALTVFIDFTGFGLILPLLPFWAQRLGANPVGVGLVLTIYALAQFVFTPVLGTLSDRYGRRPIIVASLCIEAISFAATALAGSLPILLAARFVGGLGASNIGSAQAVVADTTEPSQRARGMGLIGAAIGLGFVIGPAIGGALAALGPTVPFWVAMAVAVLNAVLVLRFLPETRARSAPREERHGPGALFSGWQRALQYPAISRLVAVNLIFTIAFTAMEAVFPLFAQHYFHWGAEQIGYLFTYVGLLIVIMQGGLVGRLVKLWGERALLIAGLLLLAVGLLALSFSTSIALLFVALGILSVGNGAVSPVTSALLSLASPPDAQGETLGLAQGIAGLGRVIGPLAAGGVYAALGPGAPFSIGGVLVVVAALIALPRVPERRTVAEASTHAGADLAAASIESQVARRER
jgi:multidrug resistance protein